MFFLPCLSLLLLYLHHHKHPRAHTHMHTHLLPATACCIITTAPLSSRVMTFLDQAMDTALSPVLIMFIWLL